MVLDGYKYVAAVHHIEGYNSKEYWFAYYGDSELPEGSLVLVRTPGYNSGNFSVCEVRRCVTEQEYKGNKPTNEIICTVDMDDYVNRQCKRKLRDDLKKQMDKVVKKNQEMMLYQAIAQNDPVMADLLARYKETLGV